MRERRVRGGERKRGRVRGGERKRGRVREIMIGCKRDKREKRKLRVRESER